MGSWWVVLTAAAAAALVDWWAVLSDRRDVERWAKPLTMALLAVVAMTAGDLDGSARTWLVLGAMLGLVGDVALLGESESRFLVGLVAFAAGHLAYVVSAVLIDVEPVWLLPGLAFMVALLRFRFFTRIVPGARALGGAALGGAVVFYAGVISAMVLAAWATGAWPAALGAMLFAISDWILGHERFAGPVLVGSVSVGRLGVMVPYHVGQALLIVGLATA